MDFWKGAVGASFLTRFGENSFLASVLAPKITKFINTCESYFNFECNSERNMLEEVQELSDHPLNYVFLQARMQTTMLRPSQWVEGVTVSTKYMSSNRKTIQINWIHSANPFRNPFKVFRDHEHAESESKSESKSVFESILLREKLFRLHEQRIRIQIRIHSVATFLQYRRTVNLKTYFVSVNKIGSRYGLS